MNVFGSVRRIPPVSSSNAINASPVRPEAFRTIFAPSSSSIRPVSGKTDISPSTAKVK